MSVMDDLLNTLRTGLRAFGMDDSTAHTVASFGGDDFIRIGDIEIYYEGSDFQITLKNPDDYEVPETSIGLISAEFPLTVVSLVLEHRRNYELQRALTPII